MRTFLPACVLVVSLLACGGGDSAKSAADGGAGGAGQGVAGAGSGAGHAATASGDAAVSAQPDASSDTTRGPWSPVGLDYEVKPGTKINAPGNGWSFVPFPDAICANGTSTGLAVNLAPDAEGLLLFMQGGGACWDATTCLQVEASVHLRDTVGADVVLAEASGMGGLFDRNNAINPFRKYSYVYVPYCTGDMHAGTRANTYTATGGVPTTIEHRGAQNVDAYLARLVPTFGEVPRIVISGVSAGGFGVTLNWWRYQAAFSGVRVDVLDDAGLMIDPNDTRFELMVDAWGLQAPSGCVDCTKRLSAWLPFYGEHMPAPRRYGLSGFLGDGVIGQYFGLDAGTMQRQLLALRTNAADNQKTFLLQGTAHSVLGEGALMTAADGSSFLPWLLDFVSDAPGWDHRGP